jgi:hypothetical protein
LQRGLGRGAPARFAANALFLGGKLLLEGEVAFLVLAAI